MYVHYVVYFIINVNKSRKKGLASKVKVKKYAPARVRTFNLPH